MSRKGIACAVLCCALLGMAAVAERASCQEQPPSAVAGERVEGGSEGIELSSREWMTGQQHESGSYVMTFTATAYALNGKTATGTQARKGIVAADPDVLPFGTRIRVSEAGEHSGVYVVEDTGPKIQGHRIDIKMDSEAEAKKFGERKVRVEVLHYGKGSK